jgi:hypothetical protein
LNTTSIFLNVHGRSLARTDAAVAAYYISYLLVVALVLVNVVIAVLVGEFAKSSMERMQEKMLIEASSNESQRLTISPLTR